MSNTASTSSALEQRANTKLSEADRYGETLAQALERQRPDIEKALGRIAGQDPDRFIRVVLTLVKQTPKLMECTPPSILGSMMQAAQLGLEFGSLGHAYLVPYNKKDQRTDRWYTEAQLIIGYRGLIDLHLRSGKVKSIVARPVYEKDVFEVWDDENGDHYKRKPHLGADRGEIVRFYGRAVLASGGSFVHVMELDDIYKRRERSKAKDSGPWITDEIAMCQKTVARAMSPWLPQSVEVANALDADEQIIRLHGSDLVVDRDEVTPPDRPSLEVVSTPDPDDVPPSTDSSDDDPGWEPSDPAETTEAPPASTESAATVSGDTTDRDTVERKAQAMIQPLPLPRVKEILKIWDQSVTGTESSLRTRAYLLVAAKALEGTEHALGLL